MPTYEYECQACKHRFDVFQSIVERVKRKCPACGKPKLERLIGGGAGFIFKGAGFYQTDYRSDAYKEAAKAEQKPAEAKPESAESKREGAEAKPEKPVKAPPKEAPAEPKTGRSTKGKRAG